MGFTDEKREYDTDRRRVASGSPPASTRTEEDGDDFCFSDLQGSLTLKLPVGKAVVQSLSFHPTETCLATAMEGRVQVWGAEPGEVEEDGGAT